MAVDEGVAALAEEGLSACAIADGIVPATTLLEITALPAAALATFVRHTATPTATPIA